MRKTIEMTKSRPIIVNGKSHVFTGVAKQYIKDVAEVLKKHGATAVKSSLYALYVKTVFLYRGRVHKLTFGDYLAYEGAPACSVHWVESYTGKMVRLRDIPIDKDFSSNLKASLDKIGGGDASSRY